MKKIIAVFLLCFSLLFTGCGKKKEEISAPQIVSDIEEAGMNEYNNIKNQHKGKIIIVNFFASWCPPCKAETPDFVSVYEEYKDKNFVIVGFSIDENKADAIKFINDYRVTYPVYLSSQPLSRQFNITGVPTSFIYGTDGQLKNIKTGPISAPVLRRIAAAALEGGK